MDVKGELQAGAFLLRYAENEIDPSVLRESHCHAEFEMISVLQGDISIMAQGRSYRLGEHQTVIVPPLLYHTITANARGTYRRVTALFDGMAIPPMLRERFLQRGQEPIIFAAREVPELRRVCESGDAAFYAPLVQGIMTQLFYRGCEVQSAETGGETDEFLQEIIAYIDKNLCGEILLEELARLSARSKSSVCHLFKQKMNVSPKQYILQKRMALAAKLIRDGIPPTEAAVRVGYDNYSNFYRMYKRHVGALPSSDKR